MARKKSTETPVATNTVEQVADSLQEENKVEQVADPTQDADHSSQETIQQEKVTTDEPSDLPNKTDTPTGPTLPEHVDKILSGYPNYESLYVDSQGGVYPKGTQHNLVKNAILYQNPYYKSQK